MPTLLGGWQLSGVFRLEFGAPRPLRAGGASQGHELERAANGVRVADCPPHRAHGRPNLFSDPLLPSKLPQRGPGEVATETPTRTPGTLAQPG